MIFRFDPVYFGHFKCNIGSIEHNYPNILKWARRIYQKPGGESFMYINNSCILLVLTIFFFFLLVKETVNMDHIKGHYYKSHRQINPTQVVPVGNGPDLDVHVDQ